MADFDALQKRLASAQETMDAYYRQSPSRQAQEHVDQVSRELESWAQSMRGELEADHADLDHEFKEIRELEAQIAELDKSLEGMSSSSNDQVAIRKYNRCVAERNALVEKHKQSGSTLQTRQESYSRRVDDFNRELAERQKILDKQIADAQQDVDAYSAWLSEKGDERFFVQLNQLYADLRNLQPDATEERVALEGMISKVQGIRTELAEQAVTGSPGARSGMLIVPATFATSEICHLLVDNASSIVSLSAELVRVLDWESYVGEEVELSLPAGLTARVPQLLIPGMAVDGQE
ncbi:MAG: hypothetical protein KAY24_05275, partial [Candidatus Eisenbacteria sp.]|nr:hypothetical protein [Candidatus Eisenbacteria bacterium]